jgi:transposase-like protein
MSITKKGGRKPIYEPSFKIAVARDYLTSNLGYGGIAEKYDLRGMQTARHFIRWYKQNYPDSIEDHQSDPVEIPINKPPLNKELQQANLKITALEMFIEIASKELGVDLQKKFGTKQSKK